MYSMYIFIFFGHQLILADFFSLLSMEPDLMVSSMGREKKRGVQMLQSTLCWWRFPYEVWENALAGTKVGDQSQCEIWITTDYTKEVAAAVGKAELQWAEEQEREKLSFQKWLSRQNSKDRSGGNVKTSRNIQPLQNWALHCCFLSEHRRCIVSMKRWHMFPVCNAQAWIVQFLHWNSLSHVGSFCIFSFTFSSFLEYFPLSLLKKNNLGKQKWREMPVRESTEEKSCFWPLLVLLAFMKDKMFLKRIFLKLTGHEQLQELTVLGCIHSSNSGYCMTLHTPSCLSFSKCKITAPILTSWNASLPQYLLMKNTIARAEHNYQFLSNLWRVVRWISWVSNEKPVFLLKVLEEIVTWNTHDMTFKRIQLPRVPISGPFLGTQKQLHFQASFSQNRSQHLHKDSSKTSPNSASLLGRGTQLLQNPSIPHEHHGADFCIWTWAFPRGKTGSTCQKAPLWLQKKAWPHDKWAWRHLSSSCTCFNPTGQLWSGKPLTTEINSHKKTRRRPQG